MVKILSIPAFGEEKKAREQENKKPLRPTKSNIMGELLGMTGKCLRVNNLKDR
jgi:hypothetical protein